MQVHERAAKTAAGSHPTDPISVHVHSPRQAQERSPTSEQKMLLLSPPALTRLFTYVNTAKPNHGKNKKKNQTISGFAQQSYLKNTWPKSLNSSCHKTRQHVTSRPACKGKAPISRAGCAGWHPTAVLSRGPHDTLVHTSLHYPPPAGGSLMLPISHFLMLAEQTCSSLRAPPAPRPGCSRQSPSETPRACSHPPAAPGPQSWCSLHGHIGTAQGQCPRQIQKHFIHRSPALCVRPNGTRRVCAMQGGTARLPTQQEPSTLDKLTK